MKKLIFFSCLLLTAAIAVNAQEIFEAVRANDLAKVKALVDVNSNESFSYRKRRFGRFSPLMPPWPATSPLGLVQGLDATAVH